MNIEDVIAQYARRIKQARIARGWTQSDLAKEAGVSAKSISRIESGMSSDLKTYLLILEALKLLERVSAVLKPQLNPLLLAEEEKRGKERKRFRKSKNNNSSKNSRDFQWGEDKA